MNITYRKTLGEEVLNEDSIQGIASIEAIEFLAQLMRGVKLTTFRGGDYCEKIQRWEGNEIHTSVKILGKNCSLSIMEHTLLKLCMYAPDMTTTLETLEVIHKCSQISKQEILEALEDSDCAFLVHTILKGQKAIVAVKFLKGEGKIAIDAMAGTIFEPLFLSQYDDLKGLENKPNLSGGLRDYKFVM